jgi:hypothetical protein
MPLLSINAENLRLNALYASEDKVGPVHRAAVARLAALGQPATHGEFIHTPNDSREVGLNVGSLIGWIESVELPTLVTDEVQSLSEDGVPVVDAAGQPVMQSVTRPKTPDDQERANQIVLLCQLAATLNRRFT